MNDVVGPEYTLSGQHLPIFESTLLRTLDFGENTFSIYIGLSHDLVAQLRVRSLDDQDLPLQSGTSDRRRFGESSYESWYAKGRHAFVLVDSKARLAAIIWFGPDPLPTTEYNSELGLAQWDTIAFRSYLPYRGTGLMTPFSKLVLAHHARSFPARKIWLETDADNEAGKALYAKLGFVERAYLREGKRVLMTM